MPAPVVFQDRLAGQQRRAEIQDARDLGLQVGGAQVQMEPVLQTLDVGNRCSNTSIPTPLTGARLRYGPPVTRPAS